MPTSGETTKPSFSTKAKNTASLQDEKQTACAPTGSTSLRWVPRPPLPVPEAFAPGSCVLLTSHRAQRSKTRNTFVLGSGYPVVFILCVQLNKRPKPQNECTGQGAGEERIEKHRCADFTRNLKSPALKPGADGYVPARILHPSPLGLSPLNLRSSCERGKSMHTPLDGVNLAESS